MLAFFANFMSSSVQSICDYVCWVFEVNGASRLLWLSVFWLILEFITRLIARNNVNLKETSHLAEVKDQGSWGLIAFSSFLMSILIFSVLHFRWEPNMPQFLFPIGVILMVIGILVRIWAVISLGKFFTMKVMIFSNHSLIEEGPYRWVRHPSYLGALITTFGFGLASGNLLVLILFFSLVAIALGYRIYVEEKALEEKFGYEWVRYVAKTYRIFPWIL